MLMFISWIVYSNSVVLGIPISSIVFLIGGLFLLYRSSQEIYTLAKTKSNDNRNNRVRKINSKEKKKTNIPRIIMEILFVDIVFSLDSILTAVAITDNNLIIVIAFTITILFMIFLSSHVIKIINKNTFLKTIAFIFIFVIAISIISQGLGLHMPKVIQYATLMVCVILYYSICVIKRKFSK